jgi:hypothetical protein
MFAHLDEEQTVPKAINHRLPSPTMPPFDGKIVFATSNDDPITAEVASNFLYRAGVFLFRGAKMDISSEFGGFNAEPQFVVEIFYKTVDEMIGSGVRTMDKRVMANQ